MSNGQIKKLERFVVNNSDLEELERHLSSFNIFEAIGVVRQELRHSDFLSFILDPARNHGLGDLVIKNIIKDVISKFDDLKLNAIEIDVIDLDGLEVRREWRNLDLLLIEKQHQIVIVVENKIDSTESENQLKKYSDSIERLYPKYRKLKIFLTPEGREPSIDDWIPYSYKEIHSQLEKIVNSKTSVIGEEIVNLIKHYNEMLRRHIVPDSDIIELSQKIYKKHKEALDIIFENKPDLQLDLSELLTEKVKSDNDLVFDSSSKTYIRFSLPEWDLYEEQKSGSGWTESGRILLLEFKNYDTSLSLTLIIGPGPDKIRKALYEKVLDNKEIFQTSRKSLTKKWTQIHKVPILSKKDLEQLESDEIYNRINKFWNNRFKKEIDKVKTIFEKTFSDINSA